MSGGSPKSGGTIWSVGHSNHPLEKFLDLLGRHGIEVLADVRDQPLSRYASQFNREPLSAAVRDRAVRYLFLGDQLGGRVGDEQFYDEQGRVLYGQVAQSPAFRQGIERLMKEASHARVSILCGEEDPTDCHRRLLVGRMLGERGVDLLHIRGDGRIQTENELAAEAQFRKSKGQLSLFETEEQAEWKSTQSVLPRRAPPNSSTSFGGPESAD